MYIQILIYFRLNYFYLDQPWTNNVAFHGRGNDEAARYANLNPLKRTSLGMGSNRFVPVSRRQFPTGRVFTTRGGSSIGHVAYPALSLPSPPLPYGAVGRRRVRWFRSSRFPRASLFLYYITRSQCTPPKRSSPLGSEVMQGAPAAGCSHGLRHAITHQRSGWNTAVAAVHGGYDNLRVRSRRVRVVPRRCDPSSWWMRRDSARSPLRSFEKGGEGKGERYRGGGNGVLL